MSRKAEIKKNLKRHGPRYGGPENGRPFGMGNAWDEAPKAYSPLSLSEGARKGDQADVTQRELRRKRRESRERQKKKGPTTNTMGEGTLGSNYDPHGQYPA
jgi:hypothetical protein